MYFSHLFLEVVFIHYYTKNIMQQGFLWGILYYCATSWCRAPGRDVRSGGLSAVAGSVRWEEGRGTGGTVTRVNVYHPGGAAVLAAPRGVHRLAGWSRLRCG